MAKFLDWLTCLVFGHQSEEMERIMNTARVRCHRCSGQWAVHTKMGYVVRWDADAEKFFSFLREVRSRAPAREEDGK